MDFQTIVENDIAELRAADDDYADHLARNLNFVQRCLEEDRAAFIGVDYTTEPCEGELEGIGGVVAYSLSRRFLPETEGRYELVLCAGSHAEARAMLELANEALSQTHIAPDEICETSPGDRYILIPWNQLALPLQLITQMVEFNTNLDLNLEDVLVMLRICRNANNAPVILNKQHLH